ncbi:hypothetical protein [Nocardiopsis composta]|uniref:Uncharacterized protein n=1 Tax=Nocardiopsis composta TaxID=157465 RepID=A0A7W8QR40_9ACTN|nr:hypothetical protein [Nocardiopsis composta]MBB5434385.1 hypothetical protein [Nocardiopsis composta]
MSGYRNARTIDASRLWSGGIATALAAALFVLVATLAVRGVLGVPALAHGPTGEFGDLGTALHAALAGAAALAATALLHLLLAAAARPTALFCWIAGACAAAAALLPFALSGPLAAQIAAAAVNALTGAAVVFLLARVGIGVLRPPAGPVARASAEEEAYRAGYRDAVSDRPRRRYGGRHRAYDPGAPIRPDRD